MGRTVITFNTYLLEEIESWRPFRRALRREQQVAFDRLFSRARAHVAEASSAARAVPFDALLMAILLDQELEMTRLRGEIERLASSSRAPSGAPSGGIPRPLLAADGDDGGGKGSGGE